MGGCGSPNKSAIRNRSLSPSSCHRPHVRQCSIRSLMGFPDWFADIGHGREHVAVLMTARPQSRLASCIGKPRHAATVRSRKARGRILSMEGCCTQALAVALGATGEHPLPNRTMWCRPNQEGPATRMSGNEMYPRVLSRAVACSRRRRTFVMSRSMSANWPSPRVWSRQGFHPQRSRP